MDATPTTAGEALALLDELIFAGMRAEARERLAACHARNPRARRRLLTESDLDNAITRMVEEVKANPDCEAVTAKLHGGFVANCYGYPAEADRAELELRPDGGYDVSVSRQGGCNRSHGIGSTKVIRVRMPGQKEGKVVR